MSEADTAIELRITRQAFVDARHANEHQADQRTRSNMSRRCSRAEVESRSASSIMISSIILSRAPPFPSLVVLLCCWIQIFTRDVIRCRSVRSSRRVPPTVGVWNTVRERANAAYTCSSEGARGPQVCSSDSARMPVGTAASGEGFANAGGPKAQPNRAMLAQCVRKFSETPVFLGHNKEPVREDPQNQPSCLVLEIRVQLWRRVPFFRRRFLRRRVALCLIRKKVGNFCHPFIDCVAGERGGAASPRCLECL